MAKLERKIIWLSVFAVAMAYVESAVVVYLRQLYYPNNLLVIFPPEVLAKIALPIELGREAATVVMILGVALLAERGFTRVFAAFVYLFGLWDIFYYVWLKVFIGWPVRWLEWDILFLIPWVWLGPWLAPVAIAFLFVIWGGVVLVSGAAYRFNRIDGTLLISGAILALAAFLQTGFSLLLEQGVEGFQHYEPGRFWWGLFLAGYLLMAAGLGRVLKNKPPR